MDGEQENIRKYFQWQYRYNKQQQKGVGGGGGSGSAAGSKREAPNCIVKCHPRRCQWQSDWLELRRRRTRRMSRRTGLNNTRVPKLHCETRWTIIENCILRNGLPIFSPHTLCLFFAELPAGGGAPAEDSSCPLLRGIGKIPNWGNSGRIKLPFEYRFNFFPVSVSSSLPPPPPTPWPILYCCPGPDETIDSFGGRVRANAMLWISSGECFGVRWTLFCYCSSESVNWIELGWLCTCMARGRTRRRLQCSEQQQQQDNPAELVRLFSVARRNRVADISFAIHTYITDR